MVISCASAGAARMQSAAVTAIRALAVMTVPCVRAWDRLLGPGIGIPWVGRASCCGSFHPAQLDHALALAADHPALFDHGIEILRDLAPKVGGGPADGAGR